MFLNEIIIIIYQYCRCVSVEYVSKEWEKQKMIMEKSIQAKLTKGLLDFIVLQLVNTHSMHGYQIINSIRKNFGVYFGPSTIYPLLNTLKKKGFVKSVWDMNSERSRKIYSLTSDGQDMLDFNEKSLNQICRKMVAKTRVR